MSIRRAYSSPSMRRQATTNPSSRHPSSEVSTTPKAKQRAAALVSKDMKLSCSEICDGITRITQPTLVFRPYKMDDTANPLGTKPLCGGTPCSDSTRTIPVLVLGNDGQLEWHFRIPCSSSPSTRVFQADIHALTGQTVAPASPPPLLQTCPLPHAPPTPFMQDDVSKFGTQKPLGNVPDEETRLHSKSIPNLRSSSPEEAAWDQDLKPNSSMKDIRIQHLRMGLQTSGARLDKVDAVSREPDVCSNLEIYKLCTQDALLYEWQQAFTAFQREPTKRRSSSMTQNAPSTEDPPRLSSPFEWKEADNIIPDSEQEALSETHETTYPIQVFTENTHGTTKSKRWLKSTFFASKFPHHVQCQENLEGPPIPWRTEPRTSMFRSKASGSERPRHEDLRVDTMQEKPFSRLTPPPSMVGAEQPALPASPPLAPPKPRPLLGRKISSMSLGQAWHSLTDASMRYLPSFSRSHDARSMRSAQSASSVPP